MFTAYVVKCVCSPFSRDDSHLRVKNSGCRLEKTLLALADQKPGGSASRGIIMIAATGFVFSCLYICTGNIRTLFSHHDSNQAPHVHRLFDSPYSSGVYHGAWKVMDSKVH